MRKNTPPCTSYVFVCERTRDDGQPACGLAGQAMCDQLKTWAKQDGITHRVRINRSGCLGQCASGPNVLVMPQKIWFDSIESGDLPKLYQEIKNSLDL